EVQQCMKLTVTNSSIDFFVPIDYVHVYRAANAKRLSAMNINCSVLTAKGLRTARATRRDGLSSCMGDRLELRARHCTDKSQ
ncbi:hypothetical protein, partial [Agrobacterium rosae]